MRDYESGEKSRSAVIEPQRSPENRPTLPSRILTPAGACSHRWHGQCLERREETASLASYARLGWPLRKKQRDTRYRRGTFSQYRSAAGIALRTCGGCGRPVLSMVYPGVFGLHPSKNQLCHSPETRVTPITIVRNRQPMAIFDNTGLVFGVYRCSEVTALTGESCLRNYSPPTTGPV